MKDERPVVFDCSGKALIGILHPAGEATRIGVVIVVGGPQYRVGSHRQFVLLARQLAADGVPVLRFDHRGIGDSEGDGRSFTALDQDINAAIDTMLEQLPHVREVVLLGLCDAASAILLYCRKDARVRGLVLMNPWVRTAESEAQSYMRHYYVQRLFQKSFWRKVMSGELAVMKAARDFRDSLIVALRPASKSADDGRGETPDFIGSMLAGAVSFPGQILLLISGRDLTAREFTDLCRRDRAWRKAFAGPTIEKHVLHAADHTFSRSADGRIAGEFISAWLRRPMAAAR